MILYQYILIDPTVFLTCFCTHLFIRSPTGKYLATAFSIHVVDSSWQMQDHKKIPIVLNIEKDLSADATVTGTVESII